MGFDGLTESGLDVPRAKDYFDIMRESHNERLDYDVDYSVNSFFGPLFAEVAVRLGEASELLLEVVNQRNIDNSTGLLLQDLLNLSNVDKKPARLSRIASQEFSGEYNTVIEEGRKVQGGGPEGELQWELLDDIRLGFGVTIDSLTNSDGVFSFDLRAPASANNAETISFDFSGGATKEDIVRKFVELIDSNSVVNDVVTAKVADSDGDGIPESFVIRSRKGQDIKIENQQIQSAVASWSFEKGKNWGVVQAVDEGPFVANSGVVDGIATPVGGWESTTNVIKASIGRFAESDEAALLRHAEQTQTPGSTAVAAIESRLLEIDVLESVAAIANDTNSTFTRPANPGANQTRIEVAPGEVAIVLWPDTLSTSEEDEVAATLFETVSSSARLTESPGGSNRLSPVIRTAETDEGQEKKLVFHYANTIDVELNLELELDKGFQLSDVTDPLISELELYISRLLVGRDVRELRIYEIISETEGILAAPTVEMRRSGGTFSSSDVSINDVEVSQYGSASISEAP